MDAYNFFETEVDYEKDGIFINYSKAGFRVKIARSGGKNTLWEKEISKLATKHKGSDLSVTENEEINDDITNVFIKTVIRSWEVMSKDKDGKNTVWKEGIVVKQPDGTKKIGKVTFDNIKMVLKDLPVLADDLIEKAGNWKLFQKHEEDEIIKN